MSIQFRIAEPQDGAAEVATATRESLQQWIEEVRPLMQAPGLQAMTPDEVQAATAYGASQFNSALHDAVHIWRQPDSTDDLYRAISALCSSLRWIIKENDDARVTSYYVEGAMRAFSKFQFENKLKFTALHRRVWAAVMVGCDSVSGLSNAFTYTYCYTGRVFSAGEFHESVRAIGCRRPAFASQRAAHVNKLDELMGTPFTYYHSEYTLDTAAYQGDMQLTMAYIDVDGPWVAGYLTPDDFMRQRFTRKRLGAWLTASGEFSDETIRDMVEGAKNRVAGGEFVIYPNDVLFGDVYVRGRDEVSSCMAHPADEYSTWDDWHPCDMYSTAYIGVGDNGLALFTCEVQGEIVGRGIWNRGTKGVVRWYGDSKKFRALRKLDIQEDSCALAGSYLALVQEGSRFIAPYTDGAIEYGKPDEGAGRVYLGNDGVCLCETSGVVGVREVYCVDTEEYHDQDECTYQSEHNTWVYYGDGWACAVTEEWVPGCDRTTIYLDGEEVEVSGRVTSRASQYLREINPTDDMLEEFFDEETEEYDGPQNYERR